MNPVVSEITVDLLLITRGILAISFGFGYAAFLQFTEQGRFLADHRTWITVVIGVGTCFIIGFNADYWTLLIIFALSSIGIIYRSIHNEIKIDRTPLKNITNSYNTKQSIDAVLMELHDMNKAIDTLLGTSLTDSNVVKLLSLLLQRIDYCKEALRAARLGKYVQKNT